MHVFSHMMHVSHEYFTHILFLIFIFFRFYIISFDMLFVKMIDSYSHVTIKQDSFILRFYSGIYFYFYFVPWDIRISFILVIFMFPRVGPVV